MKLSSFKHRFHKMYTKKHTFAHDKKRVDGRYYLKLAINFPVMSQILGIGLKRIQEHKKPPKQN